MKDNMKDLDISNIQPKRKRVEQHKYDELANQLERIRGQRDNARFLAAMFGLAAVGFALAVWMGKLIPVT